MKQFQVRDVMAEKTNNRIRYSSLQKRHCVRKKNCLSYNKLMVDLPEKGMQLSHCSTKKFPLFLSMIPFHFCEHPFSKMEDYPVRLETCKYEKGVLRLIIKASSLIMFSPL